MTQSKIWSKSEKNGFSKKSNFEISLPGITNFCHFFLTKKSLKIGLPLEKTVKKWKFDIQKKKWKKPLFLLLRPQMSILIKKRKKCFVFSVKRQKKGPKIKEVKVYTFTFFPKMAIFEKLPILTNRKKRKKWDFDQIEKSWYQKKYVHRKTIARLRTPENNVRMSAYITL